MGMSPQERAARLKFTGNDPYGDAAVVPGVTPGAPSSPDTSGINLTDSLDLGIRPTPLPGPSVDQARAMLANKPGGSVGFEPAANAQESAPAAPQRPMTQADLVDRAQGLINGTVQHTGASDDNLLRAAIVDPATGRVLGFGQAGQSGGGGGPTRVQTQMQERTVLGDSPELANLRDEQGVYQQDVRNHAGAYDARQQQLAGGMEARAQALLGEQRKLYQAAETQDAQYRTDLNDLHNKIQQGSAELASMKVDPNRYVKDRGAVLGIAAALGAFGSALDRNPNQALAYINNAIDRDIDSQKTAIATKRDTLSLAQNQYQGYMQQWGNERAAREATRANLLSAWAVQLQRHQAAAQSAEESYKIQAAVDHFNLAANQAAMDAAQLAAGSTTFQDKRMAASGGGGAGVKTMSGLDYAAANAKDRAVIDNAYGKPGAGGDPTSSLHPDERKRLDDARDKITGLMEFDKQVGLLNTALDKTSAPARAATDLPLVPASQDAVDANTILKNAAIAKAKASYGAAQQASAEGERVLNLMGANGGFGTNRAETIKTKTKVLRAEAARHVGDTLKGLSPSLQRIIQNEMGLDDKAFLRMREGYSTDDAANDLGVSKK